MMEKIGLIGTGIMGYPIAKNLLKAGYPLTIYARRDNIKKEFKALGASIASTPAELAANSSIIILLVNNSDDVTELLYSSNGIVSGAGQGAIIADMTTTDPEFSKRIAKRLTSDGIEYLDAPISGGALGAQNAQIVVMVGGKKEAHEKCFAVFEAISHKVVYMGASGSGQSVKLIHNQLSFTTFFAVCEAVILGEKIGFSAVCNDRCIQSRYCTQFCHGSQIPKIYSQEQVRYGGPV